MFTLNERRLILLRRGYIHKWSTVIYNVKSPCGNDVPYVLRRYVGLLGKGVLLSSPFKLNSNGFLVEVWIKQGKIRKGFLRRFIDNTFQKLFSWSAQYSRD